MASVSQLENPSCIDFQTTQQLWNPQEWEYQVLVWMENLIEENERVITVAHPRSGLFIPEAATFIWGVAKYMSVPPQSKYLALELYDRFCLMHIDSLHAHLEAEGKKSPPSQVKELQERVAKQSPLRILTCLMIASKLLDHKNVLSAKDVQKIVRKMDLDYTIKSINKSEVRVLQQLDYRCLSSSTHVVYVGVLVAMVNVASTERQLNMTQLYEIAVQVLDATFYSHKKVYTSLFSWVTNYRFIPSKHRAAFSSVISDRLLLAESVVVVSAWLQGGDSLSDSIVEVLSKHTHIPDNDVLQLASCIIKHALKINKTQ
ncbi:unnamed protein product [Meganyctiphanes norvegica]|uniref:Cyclin N-terminal domain-containing protein n=1 Tax=Meganyctiphanes norvegica TaxID=48144 RepID=A0AAV2SVZ3_MEGNR